jgi:hypothetical protein
MKRLILVLLMVFVIGLISSPGYAQTTDDVRITAGVSNINHVNTFTGNVEVRKAINERFEFDNTLSMATDGDVTLVQNQGLVKAFLTENVFVAGGLTVGKANISTSPFTDLFLYPSVRAGVNFDVGVVNLEPYAELNTPDLLSDNPARSLAVALTAKTDVTDNFGVLATGGVRSTRADNEFFRGRSERFIQGGVFFRF